MIISQLRLNQLVSDSDTRKRGDSRPSDWPPITPYEISVLLEIAFQVQNAKELRQEGTTAVLFFADYDQTASAVLHLDAVRQ